MASPATHSPTDDEASKVDAGFLHDLAAEASPLGERLDGPWEAAEDSAELAEERWGAWAKRTSEELLIRQLEIQGLEPGRVKGVLGKVRLRQGCVLPTWTGVIREALGEAAQIKDWGREAAEERGLSLCERARWRMFFLPFLRVARKRWTAGHREVLTAEARGELEKTLVLRLCAMSEGAFDLEFAIWGALRPAMGLDGLFPEKREAAFLIEEWREAHFLREYPVVARMAGVLVELWSGFGAEFAERWTEDRGALTERFFDGVDPGPVTGLEGSLSDPHEGGRTVLIAYFAEGRKLVYKPRSVGMEEAYFQFVDWANEAGCPIAFQQFRVLERKTHGWMEFVPAKECQTREEVVRYFERGGALLAILHALAGSDMHLENLVACGDQPVPVDLEALMKPEHGDWTRAGAGEMREISEGFSGSVLSVGLLPHWLVEGKGEVFNIGALGLGSERGFGGSPHGVKHVPKLDGRELSSGDFVPEILRGYEAGYRFLLERREELQREDGPLAVFAGRTLRYIHRNTALYAKVIVSASGARFQRVGVLRSIEFDPSIRTALLAADEYQAKFAMAGECEVRAMEQRDIPYFTAQADGRALGLGEGKWMPDFFARGGLAVARQRIAGMAEGDLQFQKKLIQATYDLVARQGPEAGSGRVQKGVAVDLRDEVRTIARTICDEAIVAGDGVCWIAPVLISESQEYNLNLLHTGLYDGTGGVLIFLLAAAKLLDDERCREMAGRIVHGLEEQRRAARTEVLKRKVSPGLGGVGGLVYALTLASRLGDDPRLLDLAEQFAGDVRVEQDAKLDMVEGAAGSIPALLALWAETGNAQWLEVAKAGGDHLLRMLQPTPLGGRSWSDAKVFLSGYSHGAAGCAASLLRLFEVTGEERYREAAGEGLAYESRLYDAEKRNWRDLRNAEGDSCMTAWCHGAPGIALGRMLGLGGRDDAGVRAEMEVALATTMGLPLSLIDHCCCGNAGRADILLTAAARLGRVDCGEAAREILKETAAKSGALGGYVCYGQLPATVRGPGFFQGLSGIGYAMLRAEHPELPSVLGMEI